MSKGCIRVSNLDYMSLILKRAEPMPLTITLEPWNYDVLMVIEPFFHKVTRLQVVDDGTAGFIKPPWHHHVYNLASVEEISFSGEVDFALGSEQFLGVVSEAMKGDFTLSFSFPATAVLRLIYDALILSIKSLKLEFCKSISGFFSKDDS
jgi:hypothetical protein